VSASLISRWLLLSLLATTGAAAQVTQVEVLLTEPICPLTTLAAEKALRGSSATAEVTIDWRHGKIVVGAGPDQALDPRPMPKLLKDTGLAVAELMLTTTGRLTTHDDGLALELPGPVPRVLLSGGVRIAELADPALANQRLIVSGHLLRGGGPPSLSVEDWAPPPLPQAPATPDVQ
jgi:hypothetical protein